MAPMVPLPSGRASSHRRAGCRYQRRVSYQDPLLSSLLKLCLRDFARRSTEERTGISSSPDGLRVCPSIIRDTKTRGFVCHAWPPRPRSSAVSRELPAQLGRRLRADGCPRKRPRLRSGKGRAQRQSAWPHHKKQVDWGGQQRSPARLFVGARRTRVKPIRKARGRDTDATKSDT